MRRIFLIMLLTASACAQIVGRGTLVGSGTLVGGVGTGAIASCNSGYSKTWALLLQPAMGANLPNFPYTIKVSDLASDVQTALLLTGSGGSVQHSTTNATTGRTIPADVVFCTANSGGTTLKHLSYAWSGTTLGTGVFVVQPGTLHTGNISQDTIYISIGNASVSTSQEDTSLLSDAHINFDMNFPNGTTLDTKDAVSGNTETNNGATAAAGLFGGAAAFNGTNQNITAGLPTTATTNLGVETFFYFNGIWQTSAGLFTNGDGQTTGWDLLIQSPTSCSGPSNVIGVTFQTIGCGAGGSGYYMRTGWHSIAWTRDTVPFARMYGNGVLASTDNTATMVTPSGSAFIGSSRATSLYFNGQIDELRQYSTVPNVNWFATDSEIWYETWPTAMAVESSPGTWATPTLRQYASCKQDTGSVTCGLRFPSISGQTVSVTTAAGQLSMRIDEVNGVTAASIGAGNAGATTQPTDFTATAPTANSWLNCITAGDLTNIAGSTTPSYAFWEGQMLPSQINDHAAVLQMGTGLVAAGTTHCQFNVEPNFHSSAPSITTGAGGSMIIAGASSSSHGLYIMNIAVVAGAGQDCRVGGYITDNSSPALTWTLQSSDLYVGTLRNYYLCQFTAPIP